MNPKRLILLSYLVTICISTAYSQNTNMPGYDVIATHFFYTYELPVSFPGNVFEFHKKKDGWYLAEVENNSKQRLKYELLWNKKTNGFNKLSYKISIDTSNSKANFLENKASTGIGDFELYAFERISYYGYSGWDWDVIQMGKTEQTFSEFELESLARAYSNYATGFLYDQYGYHFENGDTARKKISTATPISSYRISKFHEYIKKSIDYYRLLAEKNPDYQTRVGKVSLKLSGESMFAWSTLKMIGSENKATEFIKTGLYNDSILHIAELLLNDAPQNSILFTSGDNQTYSLWYMQETKGLRKDVKVIDINLLGLNRYISFLKKHEKIRFSIPDSILHNKTFSVLYKHPNINSSNSIDIDSLTKQIITNVGPISEISSYSMSSDSIRYFTNQKIYFNPLIPLNSEITTISEVKLIYLGDYLYGSDLLLIDLINMNRADKKILITFQYELLSSLLTPEKGLFLFSEN
ncbi:hypothetical protein [Lacibacter sediminis]|uniref:Uncharacterized protein n=1 Tax=Lacibacter sediminis TaxID=2760713 RepID=A0A7G5XFA9_9BACT|nr:hypothetical protein [Lacibacter sediminis]QNA44162.1 hypothetical protein H4075_19140 [Lacibacter sediminis]